MSVSPELSQQVRTFVSEHSKEVATGIIAIPFIIGALQIFSVADATIDKDAIPQLMKVVLTLGEVGVCATSFLLGTQVADEILRRRNV